MLIAFEGIDGSGKSTQAALLAAELKRRGLEVILTKEPTDGVFGKKLRASFTQGRLSAQEELELFVADRREHVSGLIAPALKRNAIVIVDRYYYSTVAYQGARGLEARHVLEVNRSFAPTPDVVFLVDIEPKLALDRIAKRGGGHDLLENLAEQTLVRDAFLKLAQSEAQFVIIDGTQSQATMHQEILRHV
jgi:dTMP kinase